MSAPIEIELHFSSQVERDLPEGISWRGLQHNDVVPTIGDHVTLNGTKFGITLLVVHRRIEYRPEGAKVHIILDRPDSLI